MSYICTVFIYSHSALFQKTLEAACFLCSVGAVQPMRYFDLCDTCKTTGTGARSRGHFTPREGVDRADPAAPPMQGELAGALVVCEMPSMSSPARLCPCLCRGGTPSRAPQDPAGALGLCPEWGGGDDCPESMWRVTHEWLRLACQKQAT